LDLGISIGVSGTGVGAAQVLAIYGQEAANQLVTPGAYTATITAIVTY
jgi:spore coat protein U-like protein